MSQDTCHYVRPYRTQQWLPEAWVVTNLKVLPLFGRHIWINSATQDYREDRYFSVLLKLKQQLPELKPSVFKGGGFPNWLLGIPIL
jgi:hypothetical protein